MSSNTMDGCGRRALAGMLLALSAGCATLPEDGGFGPVQRIAQERLKADTAWVRSDTDAVRTNEMVKKLLAPRVTAESAVQIALLNNRGLQATYAELGIAEADLV